MIMCKHYSSARFLAK